MSDYKEFQGKTLDMAIDSACDYFNCEREKLEITLLEDAKTGVFGLFGARDAKISAKKAEFFYAKTDSVFEEKFKKKAKEEAVKPSEKTQKPKKPEQAKTEVVKEEKIKTEVKPQTSEKTQKQVQTKEHKEHKEKAKQRERKETVENSDSKENFSSLLSIEDLDQVLLLEAAKRVTLTLVSLIAEDAQVECSVNSDRLCISIDTENSGLLIGKEGQTLASLEYLAARMLIKELNAHLRVQIEVGDYRSRQDSRLQEFALKLATRTRETGKSTSTRPLSSYQRRIVHLALQDMSDIQTRSIDEGPLKRVIISLAKNDKH